jgi:hypothetical protein
MVFNAAIIEHGGLEVGSRVAKSKNLVPRMKPRRVLAFGSSDVRLDFRFSGFSGL